MVTVRDLKISLSLKDANFKREMKSINTTTGTFNRNLVKSTESLNLLQQSINGFNGANIPNQININVDKKSLAKELASVVKSFATSGPQLDLKIKPSTLKQSIEDWIDNNLGKGHFIKHVPLKLQWGPLRDSINDFIDTADQKGLKHLPLQIDSSKLVESINKFKGKIPIGLEWEPLRDSINEFLDKVRNGKIVTVDQLPLEVDWKFLRDSINEFLKGVAKGKHGIMPLTLTPDIVKPTKEPNKENDKDESKNEIVSAIISLKTLQEAANKLLEEIKDKTGKIDFNIAGK